MNRYQQQGVALLTVLTMVVLISVLAASMAILHNRLTASSERTFTQSQTFQYVLAAEQMAQTRLLMSQSSAGTAATGQSGSPAASAGQTAGASSASLLQIPPLPVEGGTVSMVLQPKSDCFNINDLVKDGKPVEGPRLIWNNLLNRMGITQLSTDSVIDWLDADDNPLQNGAEASYYMSRTPSYTPANGPMPHIGDMARIKGVEPADWQKLAPVVCAFNQALPVDVNSAPATLLGLLDPALNAAEVDAWVKQRDAVPIRLTSLDEFWKVPAFSKVSEANRKLLAPSLATDTQVYRLLTTVRLGTRQRLVESTLVKQNNLPQVVSRQWK